jgi:hypothetical protein
MGRRAIDDDVDNNYNESNKWILIIYDCISESLPYEIVARGIHLEYPLPDSTVKVEMAII